MFEIPYRSMIRSGFDNIIAAGRCVSGAGYAWDVVRVIPPAILTGQAAGAAASQAIDTGKAITDIEVPLLQSKLSGENVMIHFDDHLIPADVTAVERADVGHF